MAILSNLVESVDSNQEEKIIENVFILRIFFELRGRFVIYLISLEILDPIFRIMGLLEDYF